MLKYDVEYVDIDADYEGRFWIVGTDVICTCDSIEEANRHIEMCAAEDGIDVNRRRDDWYAYDDSVPYAIYQVRIYKEEES